MILGGTWVRQNLQLCTGLLKFRSFYVTDMFAESLPSSMKSPTEEEPPGPPLVQKITSSLLGSFLLSKK